MNRSDQLIAAVEQHDHATIEALGWTPIVELLRSWAPKQLLTRGELRAYAATLGDQHPDRILGGIHALAGDWRPVPGVILGHLREQDPTDHDRSNGRAVDPTRTPAALAATLNAYTAGSLPLRLPTPPRPVTLLRRATAAAEAAFRGTSTHRTLTGGREVLTARLLPGAARCYG